jgi:hypothetical protein
MFVTVNINEIRGVFFLLECLSRFIISDEPERLKKIKENLKKCSTSVFSSFMCMDLDKFCKKTYKMDYQLSIKLTEVMSISMALAMIIGASWHAKYCCRRSFDLLVTIFFLNPEFFFC